MFYYANYYSPHLIQPLNILYIYTWNVYPITNIIISNNSSLIFMLQVLWAHSVMLLLQISMDDRTFIKPRISSASPTRRHCNCWRISQSPDLPKTRVFSFNPPSTILQLLKKFTDFFPFLNSSIDFCWDTGDYWFFFTIPETLGDMSEISTIIKLALPLPDPDPTRLVRNGFDQV